MRRIKSIPVLYLIISFLAVLSSCTFIADVDHPEADPSGLLNETSPLSNTQKNFMEGIYLVSEGSEYFGTEVVLKWSRSTLSVFTGVNAGYIVLNGGRIDSAIIFQGTWRQRMNTKTGRIEIHIPREEGARSVLETDSALGSIVLRGSFGEGNETPGRKITLKFLRSFSSFVKSSRFLVLAHRCGGRDADFLGVSENTVEMISQSEGFGAMGIEMDVRLSNDNIPFIYHDDEVNIRTTKSSVIWGKIENYNYYQIKNLIVLKNGEQIPTLKEMLNYVVEKTDLQLVWLDMKSEKNDIQIVNAIRDEAQKRASMLGRNLQIVIGVPTEEKENHLMSVNTYNQIPSLCELSLDEVRKLNSLYWAPRWTEGMQYDKVQEMHSEGRKVLVWTLDEPVFMKKYINEGNFDGVLSNYPSLVAYYHYIK